MYSNYEHSACYPFSVLSFNNMNKPVHRLYTFIYMQMQRACKNQYYTRTVKTSHTFNLSSWSIRWSVFRCL